MAENFWAAGKIHFKYHYWFHLLAATLFCLAAPFLVGMEALNFPQTGKVLEFYFSLSGIILLTPLFAPDQIRDIRDLLRTREMPFWWLHLIRLAEAFVSLTVLAVLFLFWMRAGKCRFEFLPCCLGTLATCLFLGGLGILAASLTDSLPIGYMVSMIYYVCNFGSGRDYLGPFYLFTMTEGTFDGKMWIGISGILMILLGILWRRRRI